MHKLELRTNITGQEPISLSGPVLFAETATGLRGLTRDYTLSARSLKNLTRKARETKLTIKALDRRMLDSCSALFDAAADLGPMTLVMDDQWQARVCIPKTTTISVKPVLAVQDWTVILLDGCWLRYGRTVHYNVETGDSTGMDLPYDLAAYPGTSVPATGLQVIGLPSGEFGTTRAFQLNALFTPADTTNRRLAWSSDNQDVATVSDNGLLILTGASGNFDLNCQWEGRPGSVMDYCPISVTYDSFGSGYASSAQRAFWPTMNILKGDQSQSHVDADDPSIIDINIINNSLEVRSSQSDLPYLDPTHQYKASFQYRMAPGSQTLQQGQIAIGVCQQGKGFWGNILKLSTIGADWSDHEFTFGPNTNLGDGLQIITTTIHNDGSTGTVQMRDLRIIDLTPSGGGQVIKPMGTHYGSYTIRELYSYLADWEQDSWKQAFKTAIDSDSDTVTITGNAKGLTGAGLRFNQMCRIEAGHTYTMSLEARGGGKGSWSLQYEDYWGDGFDIQPSEDWQTWSRTFTALADSHPEKPDKNLWIFDLWIFDQTNDAVPWQLRNLRFDDLTMGLGTVAPPRQWVNDGILRLHTPICGESQSDHTDYWHDDASNSVPIIRGHKYRLTCDLCLDGRDTHEGTRVNVGVGSNKFGWEGATVNLTHQRQTASCEFVSQSACETGSLRNYIYLFAGSPESWILVGNMCLEDMTAGTPQCLRADWYTSDGSDHTINGGTIYKP